MSDPISKREGYAIMRLATDPEHTIRIWHEDGTYSLFDARTSRTNIAQEKIRAELEELKKFVTDKLEELQRMTDSL